MTVVLVVALVIKPVVERRDRIGRAILKLHGEGYLTRKGA